ncbi:uncharacterized protein LOC124722780 [Schistocerca piceifrons]|uniref:uncharacterized protein LOC124722780 n=1 Tax=Schistocerca piceifrons TaxID=274613 RepID=UPI001F5EF11A|nr:uncharacterized protein LOC124722780 [Schistocerca piceifrons]
MACGRCSLTLAEHLSGLRCPAAAAAPLFLRRSPVLKYEEAMSPRSDGGGQDSADSSGNESPGHDDAARGGLERYQEAPGPGAAARVLPHLISASMVSPPYPGVMYQTSQGMVYASPSGLPNGVIFSLSSQGQLHHESGGSSQHPSGHQFLIPLHIPLSAAANGLPSEAADLSKSRK